MGYTATQMYDKFMQAINESANDSLLSWEVAAFLNQAQYQLYNELISPQSFMTRGLRGQAPYVINETILQNADRLTPFKKKKEALTDGQGYFAKPSDAEYVASVAVIREDCETNEYIDVEFVRENELYTKMKNSFTRPTWNDEPNPVRRNNVKYSTVSTGFQLWPKRQYTYLLTYYKRPVEIAIKNPSSETYLSGTANYIAQPFDVNCEFLESQQDEVIRRAVAMFSASTGNYEAMQADVALNQNDMN